MSLELEKNKWSDIMNQITQYIIALTNLYGMVQKDKVVEIYNSQNKDKITTQDIDLYFLDPPEELEDNFIETYKDYFVSDTIMENGEFELMLMKKSDKPFYVPNKEELLCYTENGYFERNKEYKALVNYVKKNFFEGDEVKAENLCEDIQGYCQFAFDMQLIFDRFNRQGISFKDINQANEVTQLIMNLSNNTRLWENNGYTPQYIFEKFEKPNLKPLPDKPFRTVIKEKKAGRNDPCPCGSGKKYKKCCLGKYSNK